MPLSTLLPDAQGTDTGGANGAGTVPTNVNTDDGDTTYREVQTSGTQFTCTVDNLPAEAQVITDVTVKTKVRWDGAGSQGSYFIRIRDASSAVNDGSSKSPSTSYVLDTATFANAYDGAGWTVAKVNSLEIGIAVNGGYGAGRGRLTYMYADVTYLTGGDFAIFVASLGPVVALSLHHLPEVARYLWQRTGNLLLPSEYRPFLEYLRRPMHFDQGAA